VSTTDGAALHSTPRRPARGRTHGVPSSFGGTANDVVARMARLFCVGWPCEPRGLCKGSRPVRSGARCCPALERAGMALLLLPYLPASRKLCGKQVAYAGA